MTQLASILPSGVTKFGIGQPVPRREDPVLLRGEGRYTDDVRAAGQVHLAMVRSPHAHGIIRAIDLGVARAVPGVLGAWTVEVLIEAGFQPFKSAVPLTGRDGTPYRLPPRLGLASGRVRFVGDPVAFVVADSIAAARDGAEAVTVEIEPLPAVTDARAAVRPGAPQLFDEVPGNVVLDFHHGDAAAVSAAFEGAAHVVRLQLDDSRVVINPMELRGCLAQYDPARAHWTLQTQTQGVFGFRDELAALLGVPRDSVTVSTGNVGGSFGMRISVFPEQLCALFAARALGRPVKWLEERSPSFLSDTHGRAQSFDASLALDGQGRFLALRIAGVGDMGAYLAAYGLLPATRSLVINACSLYRLPLLEVATECVVTNTSPVAAYRGAGRPEANYVVERLIDEAARQTGIDRIELRRRNQITVAELPYAAQSGLSYDSGDFTGVMDQALAAADVVGFADRRAQSDRTGKLRGLGIGCFLEATSSANAEMGAVYFEADATVTMVTGTLDYGQGHLTTFAQILGQRLGIPFERIRLVQGDSDRLLAGGGTGGSRSAICSGTAVLAASDEVERRGKQLAAWMFEASEADVEVESGRFTVVGTDRSMTVLELAQAVRSRGAIPDDLPQTLDVSLVNPGPGVTFPNGCHVCEVEIERETGVARVVRYTMVDDIGTVINPLLLEGQLHGGVVQGIGQTVLERTVYDGDGQMLSGSFMDYCMPRAADVPTLAIEHRPSPTASNPLGAKGVGEAGCTGSLPAIMNAVADALSTLGIGGIDMPATPERVWRAIRSVDRQTAGRA